MMAATASQHQRLRRKPKSLGSILVHPIGDDGQAGGVEAKGPAELVPGDGLDPLLMEPLDPAVDGAGSYRTAERRPCSQVWPSANSLPIGYTVGVSGSRLP